MSWDEFKEEKACPCGAGTYTTTQEVNDWGQRHEWHTMNCRECLKNYVLFTYSYYDSNSPTGTWLASRWVLIADKKAVDGAEEKIKALENSMLAKAKKRYLQRWLEPFSGKTKKSTWGVLRRLDRSHVPSLGTFYKHTKHGVEDYLEDFFAANRLMSILELLNISDAEITELNKRLEAMGRQYETLRKKMIDAGRFA